MLSQIRILTLEIICFPRIISTWLPLLPTVCAPGVYTLGVRPQPFSEPPRTEPRALLRLRPATMRCLSLDANHPIIIISPRRELDGGGTGREWSRVRPYVQDNGAHCAPGPAWSSQVLPAPRPALLSGCLSPRREWYRHGYSTAGVSENCTV